jgi:hypothetical protein
MRLRVPSLPSRTLPAAALAAVLAACAEAPTTPEGGLFVTPKANKNYIVDGSTIAFTDLEARLASDPPSRVVIQQTRQREGSACVVMLGFKLGVPVWTRSLSGRMQQLKSELGSSEIATIESCR